MILQIIGIILIVIGTILQFKNKLFKFSEISIKVIGAIVIGIGMIVMATESFVSQNKLNIKISQLLREGFTKTEKIDSLFLELQAINYMTSKIIIIDSITKYNDISLLRQATVNELIFNIKNFNAQKSTRSKLNYKEQISYIQVHYQYLGKYMICEENIDLEREMQELLGKLKIIETSYNHILQQNDDIEARTANILRLDTIVDNTKYLMIKVQNRLENMK